MHGISYIIPTYNRPQELNRAIASVMAERIGPSELIIVDDSSIPVQFPDEIQARLGSDIHHRRSPQKLGFIQARYVGLEMAKYDFVMYLDDDDVSFPNRSRDLLAAMRDEYAFVAGKCEIWIGQERITIPNLAACELTPINLLPFLLHLNGVLWRKATLLAFGGFDNRVPYLGEHITMHQMLLRSEKALLVDPIVARYEWLDGGLTAQAHSARQWKDFFIAYHDILLQESQPSPYHDHNVQIRALLPEQTIITVDDYLSVVARYFAHQQ